MLLGCAAQAKVSAISALNQVFICSKLPVLQPLEAPDALATEAMAWLPASYWNTAVSQEA